jgi:hypothetical protein
VHGYRGSQQKKKSVRYGFGTAELTVQFQHTQQHGNRGREGAFTHPYSCTAAVRLLPFSGHDFQSKSQSINSGQAVLYGSLGTENEGTVVVIFPVKFMHEFRGRDKYTVGLILLM